MHYYLFRQKKKIQVYVFAYQYHSPKTSMLNYRSFTRLTTIYFSSFYILLINISKAGSPL